MSNSKGFTLIEVLVVAAIIGILAAIAIPNYRDHIRRANIASARAALTQAAQNMERFHARNNTYVGGALDPTASDGGRYALQFAAGQPTAATFLIEANGNNLAGDPCVQLTINHQGARVPAACW